MTLPLAGQIIRASDITQYAPRYIQKSGTESRTSNATLTNDADFAVVLQPGTYRVSLYAHASNTTTTPFNVDIQTAWTFSGTVTNTGRSCFGPGWSTIDARGGSSNTATTAGTGIARMSGHGFGTAIIYGICDTAASVINEELLFTVTVAGTLNFQWAQNVSSGTATSLSAASRMTYQLVETA